MKRSLLFCLVLIFAVFNSTLQAQEKGKSLWKFNTALGFSYYEGNVEKLDTRLKLAASRADSVVEYSTSYQFIYGELNENRNNLVHDFKFTVDFLPYHVYSPFAGAFVFSNIYKGFRLRNSYLAGVKRKLIYTDKTHSSISAAIMYDYATYGKAGVSEDLDIKEQVLRLSLRPKIKTSLSEQIVFSHISFWQPEIEHLENYIYQATTSLDFNIKKNMSLGMDYLYYYNNSPPYNSIRKRDQKFLLSLKFSL